VEAHPLPAVAVNTFSNDTEHRVTPDPFRSIGWRRCLGVWFEQSRSDRARRCHRETKLRALLRKACPAQTQTQNSDS
jgi:hypothetical protein